MPENEPTNLIPVDRRFILRLVGANGDSGFGAFMYAQSRAQRVR
jgi:hypothetical protein